jgi:hypothetical protein
MFKSGGYGGRRRNHAAWTTAYAGKEAFTSICSGGYKQGNLLGYQGRAHRVIWAMETGAWPVDQIDHEDHDRSNNRWVNLKEATCRQNTRNATIPSTNVSGIMGVSWSKNACKWRAYISIDSNQIHIGYFTDIREAAIARKVAECKHGFHINHGKPAINNSGGE